MNEVLQYILNSTNHNVVAINKLATKINKNHRKNTVFKVITVLYIVANEFYQKEQHERIRTLEKTIKSCTEEIDYLQAELEELKTKGV